MKDTKQLLEHLFEKYNINVPDKGEGLNLDVAESIVLELMEACGMFEEEEDE